MWGHVMTTTPLALRTHLFFAVSALLVALALSSHEMSRAHLWWDEHFTLLTIGAAPYGPPSMERLAEYVLEDGYHTPTFYVLLMGWALALGQHQFELRLFPLLVGIIALACTYRAGVWLGGRKFGLVALCILAGAGYWLYQMTLLRTYSLFLLFSVLALASYWRLLQQPLNRRTVGLFLFSGIGLLYSHYYALLIVAAIGLYHLLFVRKDRRWWQVAGWALVVGATYLPWLPVLLEVLSYERAGFRYGVMSTVTALHTLGLGLSNGFIPFVGLIGLGVWAAGRTASGRYLLWVSGCLLGLILAANQFVPVLLTWRYGITLWVLAALITAYGSLWWGQQARQRWLPVGLLLVWWASAGWALWSSTTFRDTLFNPLLVPIFRPNSTLYEATRTIRQHAIPATDIGLYDAPLHAWGSTGSYDYYTHDWGFSRSQTESLVGDTTAAFQQTLTDYTRDALRIWWLFEREAAAGFRREAFNALLTEQQWAYCATPYQSADLQADLYARHSMCCAPQEQPKVVLDGAGIALNDWAISGQTADELHLIASWQIAPDVPPYTYSTGWYILDNNGQVVAQQEVALPLEAYRCVNVHLTLPATPQAEYFLWLSVYNVQTGERLGSAAADSTLSPNLIPLGTVSTQAI
jgi:4-amino-4-deoxy-L-arabinose transferase-like glycosyltransferase